MIYGIFFFYQCVDKVVAFTQPPVLLAITCTIPSQYKIQSILGFIFEIVFSKPITMSVKHPSASPDKKLNK